MSLDVLFVCRANLCRSAMAEALLRAALPAGADVTATSAGTHALVGHAMDGAAAHAVRELGGDPDPHRARPVSAALVTASDLVLTATAAQRDEVEARAPAARDRIFTLREFARLGAALPEPGGQRPAERIHAVAARRRRDPDPGPTDDIGDPFGAPWWQVQACARVIDEAVRATLRALGVAGVPRVTPRSGT